MKETQMVLEGLKIVSLCHFLQGPAAMQYLSDMGALVVKIEPLGGAFERHWASAGGTRVADVTPLFFAANRNIQSLAVDLKTKEGKELVLELIKNSHVVAENYRPGVLDRLGLGYEAIKSIKPDIIFASASGFGSTGPYVALPGQDLLIQAMSGLAFSTSLNGRRPTAVGCAAADQHGAALLAMGIAGAYAKWLRTGEGTRVESSLLSAGVDLQTESLVTYRAAARGKEAFAHADGLVDFFHEAPYGVYAIRDGFVALSLNPLAKISRALNTQAFDDLLETDAYENRNVIAERIAGELRSWDYRRLSAAFDAEEIWYCRVNDYDDVFRNPQLQHTETFEEFEVGAEKITLVRHPLRYDGQFRRAESFALKQGADARSILSGLGFSAAQIDDLRARSIIFVPEEGLGEGVVSA
jgi:crotonobetainyl-CoA:carnitine CoA-transferase CaiB-like acyl-CoA transferase